MTFIKGIISYLIIISIALSAVAQEKRISFDEKLRLQEKQERENLEHMIESASDEEYRSYLNGELSQEMKNNEINSATVIVDVTDLKSTSTATKRSANESLGIIKLKSLMIQSGLVTGKSMASQNIDMTVTNTEWQFSNKAESQRFEQVNVELVGSAIATLLDSPDVKDIFITTGSQYGMKYSAINTELGRFYPPIVTKEYDKDFLRKGYLDDLMVVLEQQETTFISVTLNGYPEKNSLSDQGYTRGYQLTDEVLSTLNPDDYEVLSKSAFGFSIEAGATAVEQLGKDDRIDFISEDIPEIYILD